MARLNFFSAFIGLLAFSLLCSSCGKSVQVQNVHLASNRQMGVAIRTLKLAQPDGLQTADYSNYLSSIVSASLQDAYGAKVNQIKLDSGSTLETPDNLFNIGLSESDDIFVLDTFTRGQFDAGVPPPTEDDAATKPKELKVQAAPSDQAEFAFTILNGGNLRAITLFKFSVPTKSNEGFEADFKREFRKSVLEHYPNPNLYPKSNPLHYADLLYVFSKQQESHSHTDLTCQNSPDLLRYYPKAEQLYRMATARGNSRAIGQQQEIHQLSTRLLDSQEKSAVLKECLDDDQKSFALTVDYGKISPENQLVIAQALQTAGIETLLRQYTNKPSLIRFTLEPGGEISLFLELRFHEDQYHRWIKDRVPSKDRDFQVVSLDPYYALMQKLVVLKTSLPNNASSALQQSFQNLKATMSLKTLINGEVLFGVDGKYFPQKKTIKMAYPNSLVLLAPGFDSKTIATRNNEIFQERGWIALGNCKNLEGSYTEDGLLYKFFGFPCQ